MYNHITIKELRPRLPKVIRDVDEKLDRYLISKHGKSVAVILSVDDFESLMETLNEKSDLKNLRRIRRGLEQAKKGRVVSWEKVKARHRL